MIGTCKLKKLFPCQFVILHVFITKYSSKYTANKIKRLNSKWHERIKASSNQVHKTSNRKWPEDPLAQQTRVPCGVSGESKVVPQVRLPIKRTKSWDMPNDMQEYPAEVDWQRWGSGWNFQLGVLCINLLWINFLWLNFGIFFLTACTSVLWNSNDCWGLFIFKLISRTLFLLVGWFTLPVTVVGSYPHLSTTGIEGYSETNIFGSDMGTVGSVLTSRVNSLNSDNTRQFTNIVCIIFCS